MIHQLSNVTAYNRYPIIFNECSKLSDEKNLNILSFGCSTGEEILTLKEIYFPFSEIYGVEINEENIKACYNKIEKKYIMNYDQFLTDDKKFDFIFAMSCLCKWEDTYHTESSQKIYPFQNFEFITKVLDSKLKTNGFIVIYNSNYIFEDTCIFTKYEKISNSLINESGFVHKFNKNNEKIYNCNYNGVIFRKFSD